ncbi:phosphocholine-specific phospholipase C [Candidimonas nitroreducens]|uniref:phospholipase C n=1 Tax=Candidimonas nitroreducens TaxID=683354 RepID=A0A225MW50_9BURK|nr:phospholipase C, phosphocholine-specific [Candidimonas nitroreducens]OWT65445.1 phospholipase C, phosphocholine-specific [Candidimonas nitroreducens]
MNHPGRREFLKRAGAAAASVAALDALPESIRKAMAIPAHAGRGTIEDVRYIVVLMQENRAFDHYLGHLSGVRGYGDRFPVELPGGAPVWQQPRQQPGQGSIAPFHLDTHTTSAQCVGDLNHSWGKTQAALNGGRYDRWPRYKTDMTMGYHLRQDIPFHYALADAFTVCDHYFCSIPGSTHPNRMFLMTGTNDPSGKRGGPLIDNYDPVTRPYLPALTWATYPERLQQAGVSWQVYQEGTNPYDPYNGNFGLNVLANFRAYIEAPAGSPLRRRAMTARPLEQFARDVHDDRLPQVSWLLPPAAYSEHPKWTSAYGASYISRVLDALTANPDVWSRSVLFVVYDENDGFFDHMVPPSPPAGPGQGKSTVAVADELHTVVNPEHKPRYKADGLPYGLGPRVPMTVVSPWSKGGHVCSQVFDHTSVIRFIERRFGVREPNISAWRRAVCGDLGAALDFSRHDGRPPSLPDTRGYQAMADEQCNTLQPPSVPEAGAAAPHPQEPGTRPARALPYDLHVADDVAAGRDGLRLRFDNRGRQGVCLWVRSRAAGLAPRCYTLEAGKQLEDLLPPASDAASYDWSVYGPNGYVRIHRGSLRPDSPARHLRIRQRDAGTQEEKGRGGRADGFSLELKNSGPAPLSLVLKDLAYGQAPREFTLLPGATYTTRWDIVRSHHWYDIGVSVVQDAAYERRYAGHIETGHASRTDPAA